MRTRAVKDSREGVKWRECVGGGGPRMAMGVVGVGGVRIKVGWVGSEDGGVVSMLEVEVELGRGSEALWVWV